MSIGTERDRNNTKRKDVFSMSEKHTEKITQLLTPATFHEKGRMTQRAEPRPQRAELRNTKGKLFLYLHI